MRYTRYTGKNPSFFSQLDNDSAYYHGKLVGPTNECAPTSMAIVAAAFGRNFGIDASKRQLEDYISHELWTTYGMRTSGTVALMAQFMKDKGFEVKVCYEADTAVSQIKAALDAGYLLIVHTGLTGAGHVIVVFDYDDKAYGGKGAFICHDPWGEWSSAGYLQGTKPGGSGMYGDAVPYSYALASREFYWSHRVRLPGFYKAKVTPTAQVAQLAVVASSRRLNDDDIKSIVLKQHPMKRGTFAKMLQEELEKHAPHLVQDDAEWVKLFRNTTAVTNPNTFAPGKLSDFFYYKKAGNANQEQALTMFLKALPTQVGNYEAPWYKQFLTELGEQLASCSVAPALEVIKKWEGFESVAYPDPAHGWEVPTIGYGTTHYKSGAKVIKGDTITEKQALTELEWFVETQIVPVLRRTVPCWMQLNMNQKNALISFSYNLGAHWFGQDGFKSISDLMREFPRKNVDAKRIFMLYSKSNGQTLEGLVRRRENEAELFLA